jgi:holo-[acyl-carrier protein] synthase
MAVVGLGMDLADVGRIRRILEGPRGERFARRICTDRERGVVGRRADPAEGYAARFAAKEAFVKALGVPPGIGWHHVEVVRAGGKPTLWLTGRAAAVLKRRGVRRLHLSLTHDAGIAGAVVVLED